jgi:hypothetical protein
VIRSAPCRPSLFKQASASIYTLQSTALVHEAYLRLVGRDRAHWQNRQHFFAVAAKRCGTSLSTMRASAKRPSVAGRV